MDRAEVIEQRQRMVGNGAGVRPIYQVSLEKRRERLGLGLWLRCISRRGLRGPFAWYSG